VIRCSCSSSSSSSSSHGAGGGRLRLRRTHQGAAAPSDGTLGGCSGERAW
jgi:hypothetical protein